MNARNKNVNTERRDCQVKIRLSASEKQQLLTRAKSTGQKTISSYLRTLGLNMPLQSKVDQHALHSLIQCKNDLQRLGNLFKLYLKTNGDKPLRMPYFENYEKVSELLIELEDRQNELIEISRKLV